MGGPELGKKTIHPENAIDYDWKKVLYEKWGGG